MRLANKARAARTAALTTILAAELLGVQTAASLLGLAALSVGIGLSRD